MRGNSGPHPLLTLRWKIFYLVGGVVVLMGALYVLLGEKMDKVLREEHDRKGIALANNISNLSTEHVLLDSPLTLSSMLEEAKATDRDIVYLFVQDRHGDVMGHTFIGSFPPDLLEIARAKPAATAKSPAFRTENGIVADFAAPIMGGAAGYLHLGLSEDGIVRSIERTRGRRWAVAGIFLAVGLGASHLLAAFLTRPLGELIRAAGELGKGNLDGKCPVRTRDEIGLLSAAFNTMGDELAAASDARRKAEKSLRRAHDELEERVKERTEQLAAANRELESFTYSVSHDLRAPLRGIEGFSLALQEDCGDKLDEKGADYLRRIRRGCERMGSLIEDFLKLSRLSRAEFQPGTVDLSAMANAIAEELRESSPGRKVEVVVAPGMTARGDPVLLRAMLNNLFQNAWKFTRKAAGPKIEFGFLSNAGKTTYYVRDNGVGFDMEYAEKLFGAFQRLHSTEEFEGSGIGLATVKRIVMRHGGTVRAEGETGKGAAFYFTLGREAT